MNMQFKHSSRHPKVHGSARLVLALALCAPLSCAFCGSDKTEPVHIAPIPSQLLPAAATPAPTSVLLEQGPCESGFFLSMDKRCVPLAWHCAPAFYHGGPKDGCDCNCGVPDPDCDESDSAKWCYHLGRTEPVMRCEDCN